MSHHTPDDTPTGRFTERGRTLVVTLRALAEERALAETAIEREGAGSDRDARRHLEEESEATHLRYDADAAEVAQAHRARMRDIRERAARTGRETRQAHDTERSRILEKAATNEENARRQLEEAIWLAETVYEAAEDQPEEQFRRVESEAGEHRADLDAAGEKAQTILRKNRQARPAIDSGADEADAGTDPSAVLDRAAAEATGHTRVLAGQRLARLFRGYSLALLVLLAVGGAGALALSRNDWHMTAWVPISAAGMLLVVCASAAGLYTVARRRALAVYRPLMVTVARGRRAAERCLLEAASARDRADAELLDRRDDEIRSARETYEPILAEIAQRRDLHLARIEEKYPALLDSILEQEKADLEQAGDDHARRRTDVQRVYEETTARTRREHEEGTATRENRSTRAWASMERTWRDGMEACHAEIAAINAEHRRLCPDWSDPAWKDWAPPTDFAPSVSFGALDVDLTTFPGGLPDDERLAVPGPTRFTLPVALDFPNHCSLLLRSGIDGRDAVLAALQSLMLRLLTALPPGKVRFTIIDPVGLGENFAGFMHLADYDESFVASRIWTETRHIEQRLAALCEHMETVIQKYLRNEFETIAAYNEQAGELAEPYRFLVISDFPANFSETAARRLVSIATSGARCGVHTLISVDDRLPLPPAFDLADLETRATTILHEGGAFRCRDEDLAPLPLTLEPPPSESFLTETLRLVGEASRDATRVEVPFEVIAPAANEQWSGDCTRHLSVPLGRCGATKLQELVIGPGTCQHALVAGRTGSGKSTLLHVLITNLALWYSPDEVQFYLVDFKKGVEFKTYAAHGLPHARVVAVESDREFGLSVLQRVDTELTQRGERFRSLGVQDLATFRHRNPDEAMPRVLLVIDEFQEMFVEDDRLGQEAALLLDRVVRQGRAFGVHVLLGSQTLGGAYTLARSTMGQMQVRIALQCSEADSYLIMSEDNAAARLLSRPGEAIYNDAGGAIEGNSPFQICWLPDVERESWLAQVQELARTARWQRDEPQIVFEGNVAADMRENRQLERELAEPGWPTGAARRSPPRVWLGEPIAIKAPTAAVLRRQSGHNLLVVGQQEEAALALTTAAIASLAAQAAPAGCRKADRDGARFFVLDGTPADSPRAGYLARVVSILPHTVHEVKWRSVGEAMNELAATLDRRRKGDLTDAPPIFVVIYGLQRFRMLRAKDDFSFSSGDDDAPTTPDRQFADLLRDGAPYGIHVLAWCDTLTNLNRTLDRSGLREFEMRVIFQMSGADSTQLIDSPLASNLGLRRALYHHEEEGVLEKFRPYALPDEAWLASLRERLAAKAETVRRSSD